LPLIANNESKIVLIADDSSKIITNPLSFCFYKEINKLFTDINDWFNANLLSFNFDKSYFLQFSTENTSLTNWNITYDDKGVSIIPNMNFLGIIIDNTHL